MYWHVPHTSAARLTQAPHDEHGGAATAAGAVADDDDGGGGGDDDAWRAGHGDHAGCRREMAHHAVGTAGEQRGRLLCTARRGGRERGAAARGGTAARAWHAARTAAAAIERVKSMFAWQL